MDFIVTGTQAYGPVNFDSDLDIVLEEDNAVLLGDFLLGHKIETYRTEAQERVVYGGFYFDLLGIKINIITVRNKEELIEWERRTERMRTKPIIGDKQKRIAVFNEEEQNK